MTIQRIEAEPTQTHEETGRSQLAGLIGLASLGLIPLLFSAPTPVMTYSTASESTYTVRLSTAANDFEMMSDALLRIHDTLLSEAKELDMAARRVLSQHLWDLYIL